MVCRRLLFVVALAGLQALALPQRPQTRASAILLPSVDPFYIPPEGYEDSVPGTILDSRPVPGHIALFGLVPINLAEAYQLLYRTTDTFGNPSATVTTILIPHNADRTKLLSYQAAEDAAYVNCAPSYALQFGSDPGGPFGTIITQAELLLIEAALFQGWIVSVPDHQGPLAAFLANTYAGHAVLDGIRAVLASSDITHIADDPKITLWGYSGGSLATGFAAELQPTYAPELDLAGAALGGTIGNISTVTTSVNRGSFAGLLTAGVLGLASTYSAVDEIIADQLLPDHASEFLAASSQCAGANAIQFAFHDVFAYLRDREGILAIPSLKEILDDNSPGNAAPAIPLFVYKSVHDEVSPIADTDRFIDYYCAEGTVVEYQRDLQAEHGTLSVLGAASALIWLKERMDGAPAQIVCSRRDVVSSLLDPGALEVLGESILKGLLSVVGFPVGGPLRA